MITSLSLAYLFATYLAGTLGLSTAGEKISPLNPSMTSPTARRMYLRPPGDDSIVLDKNLNLIIAQLK